MRVLRITIFCILVILFHNKCDNMTESENNSILGNWYLSEDIIYYNESGIEDIEEYSYDNSIDDFYNSTIMKIDTANIFWYENKTDRNTYKINSMDYIINDGFLALDNISEDIDFICSDTVFYNLDDDILTFIWYKNNNIYRKMCWVKYKDSVPPNTWIIGLENDDYEPDDEYQWASEIVVDEEAQKHIILENDIDYLKFQAEENETYLIQIFGYMDNYLRLYDSQENRLVTVYDNDYDINVETTYKYNPVLVWKCDNSGTYYIRIAGSDDDVGLYQISICLTDIRSPL